MAMLKMIMIMVSRLLFIFLVASRILTVGDPHRAFTAAKCLDSVNYMAQKPEELGPAVFYHASNRGFTTFTGHFKGTRISIISIGMVSEE